MSGHHKHRHLLESSATASTGSVPVRGAVTVKEWHNPDASASSDCSIMCVDGPACAGNPCSADSLVGSSGGAQAPKDKADSSSVLPTSNLVLVIAAVAGPIGLALCVVLLVVGVLAARRRRYKKQQQKQKEPLVPPDGAAASSSSAAAAARDSMDGPASRSSYAGYVTVVGTRRRSIVQIVTEHILPKPMQGARRSQAGAAMPADAAQVGPGLAGQWPAGTGWRSKEAQGRLKVPKPRTRHRCNGYTAR